MQKDQKLNLRKRIERLALILGLIVLYVVLFRPLTSLMGIFGTVFIFIPVVITGWYFGAVAGFVVGALGVFLNLYLIVEFNGPSEFVWVVKGWPDGLVLAAAGCLAGIFKRELSRQTNIAAESRSHARFVSLMGLADRDFLDPKMPNDQYIYLANHLTHLFVVDYAYITSWDVAQTKMTFLMSTRDLEKPCPKIVFEPNVATEETVLLKNGQMAFIQPGLDLPRVVDLETLTELSMQAHSEFAIPLVAGDYKFGVVVLGFDSPHILSRDDVIYDQLVASQIALVLWTSEQDTRIKKQLREANALANIERALSETEQVGIETVIQLIVNSAKELIPVAEGAVLHMVEEENEILVPRAVAGLDDQPKTKLHMRLGEGVAGQVIASGNVIAIPDICTDSRFIHQTIPVKYRSLVVVPIKGNERVLGTISIYSDQPNVFTTGDSHLLGALGIQAAIAIENANLLETTQLDLKEINILYHISQDLSASLDPDELMSDVIHILQQSFGFYYLQIFVVDPKNGGLLAHHGSGEVATQYKEQGYRITSGSGIVGHVAEIGESFMTNNVDRVVFYKRDNLLPNTQSELAVPIKTRDQVFGVLDIQEISPNHFTDRQLKLMTAVAEQLAVTLQKANLYSELQNSLSHEKETRAQMLQIERLTVAGRLLASVAHELNNPLQAIQNVLFLLKEEEELTQQGQQDMNIILSETERMASLISRLRNTYRDTQAKDFVEVDLNDVIEDVYALTATHLRHKNIIFTFRPDPELPCVPAITDQMRQVALNLFMNAIEAMQLGGDFIVETRHFMEEKKILISFADTGVGISAEIFPRIFEPFVTDKETGTGLGLTITYDIIHLHQGKIEVENNIQGGATFKVWLPENRLD